MKPFLFLITLISMGNLLPAQVLFTYGSHKVEQPEFLKAYNKNNTSNGNEQKLREYLDLFIAFKLKVQAAKDRKMDTLPEQKSDLQNYRRQIEVNYMMDSNLIHDLSMEAFQRSQYDIRLSHIFIPFSPDNLQDFSISAAPDTTAAYEKIQKAYAELRDGNNFSLVAEKYSSDPSVKKNKGDLGYITVFSLPYELENIAYSLSDGKFSTPYRSKAGYHIIKRTATRPAFGKIQAAQILLAFATDASEKEKQVQKKLADSLYQSIKKGSDFSLLAKQFSSERNVYNTGGLMSEFGAGTYDSDFETHVFALEKDGDISKPFETSFGIHIVKRVKQIPVITDRVQAENLFKELVAQDARATIVNDRFVHHIMKETGYKKQFDNDSVLWRLTDSFLINNQVVTHKKITGQTVLFSFDKKNILVKDWLDFIRTPRSGSITVLSYPDQMNLFISESAKKYYQEHLEDYNKDFRNQITEFSEGNLLFGIMEAEVWGKAEKDKKGLEEYYQHHKEDYIWGPSAHVIIFSASDRETADAIESDIKKYTSMWKTLGEDTHGKITADSTRLELEQIPGEKHLLQPGYITQRITDETNETVHFMYILSVNPKSVPRSFEEARGLVINDYQTVLEEKWLRSLKKKYPVKINEKLLQAMAE